MKPNQTEDFKKFSMYNEKEETTASGDTDMKPEQPEGRPSYDEASAYLRSEGLDPELLAREGSVFVKTLIGKIELEKHNAALIDSLQELTNIVEVYLNRITIDDEGTHREYNRLKSAIERAKSILTSK